MHDRRIDGITHTFGNYGALWMNAMTWWDHETGSVWTQPWGRALIGDFKGTSLRQLPASIVPWESWLTEHPTTLALDYSPGPARLFTAKPTDRFVLGVRLADSTVGFLYPVAAAEGVINADVGPFPVVVHTNPQSRVSHIFLRSLTDGTILTFTGDGENLIDDQTGTNWEPSLGLALDGPLQGEALREVPYSSSYDWAWLDFYPETEFYIGGGQYVDQDDLNS